MLLITSITALQFQQKAESNGTTLWCKAALHDFLLLPLWMGQPSTEKSLLKNKVTSVSIYSRILKLSRLSQGKFSCLHFLKVVQYKIYLGSKCQHIYLLETEIFVDQDAKINQEMFLGPRTINTMTTRLKKKTNRSWRNRLTNSHSSNHKFPRKLRGKNFHESPPTNLSTNAGKVAECKSH